MTKRMTDGKTPAKYLWAAGFALLLLLQMGAVFYYGSQKEGFHEDEYYSFYSTNRTAGLYEPDREWVDRETYRDEFVVKPGEGFRYGQVALVQSWDVHPPFYYFLLHTACSLFPGVFSKWIGIGVNLVAFAVSFFLLGYLAWRLSDENKLVTFLSLGVCGFNAVIISGVLFIRMYEWLTLFILACACLHVAARKREKLSIARFLLPLMAVSYLGFLTQYYYVIFFFFIGLFFGLDLLFRRRRPKEFAVYVSCCALSLLFAVVSYPASLSHIFRGYRGKEAISGFMDSSDAWGRLRFFGGLLNEYVFDGGLWFLLAAGLAAGLLLLVLRRGKRGEYRAELGSGYAMLLFACAGYFFVVSQTALLLGETSNRYELPVYGIVMLLLVVYLYKVGRELLSYLPGGRKAAAVCTAGLAIILLGMDIHELVQDKVIFLYREERERVEYAREHSDVPAVVFYHEDTPYNVWRCAAELMEYPRAYFVSQGNPEPIQDETIAESDSLIVYAADHERQEEMLRELLQVNPGLEGYRLVSEKEMWKVYEFY